MNSKEKISIFIFILILIVINENFEISSDYDLNIITNIEAIFIGFTATAISIISTNKYSKQLYSIEVNKRGTVTTQFDILLDKIKIPTYYNLILMFIIVLTDFFKFPYKNYISIFVINLSLIGIFLNFISIKYLYGYCRKSVVEMQKSD